MNMKNKFVFNLELKALMTQFSPELKIYGVLKRLPLLKGFISDYESAEIKSLQRAFGTERVYGCVVHYISIDMLKIIGRFYLMKIDKKELYGNGYSINTLLNNYKFR